MTCYVRLGRSAISPNGGALRGTYYVRIEVAPRLTYDVQRTTYHV